MLQRQRPAANSTRTQNRHIKRRENWVSPQVSEHCQVQREFLQIAVREVDVRQPREALFENFWREIRGARQREIKSKGGGTAPDAPEVCERGADSLLYNRSGRLDPSASKAFGALPLTRMQSTGTIRKLRVPVAVPLQRLTLLERLVRRRSVQVGVRVMQRRWITATITCTQMASALLSIWMSSVCRI